MFAVKICHSSPSNQTLGVEVQQNQLAAPPVVGSDRSIEQHLIISREKEVAGSAVSPQQQTAQLNSVVVECLS